jgi:hypothetical protein
MIDISKYLIIKDIELWSNITCYYETSPIINGKFYRIPNKRHDWELRINYQKFLFRESLCDYSFSLNNLIFGDWKYNLYVGFLKKLISLRCIKKLLIILLNLAM